MSASAAEQPTPAVKELTTEQEIIEEFNRMRQDQSNLMSRIAEVEAESHEHHLVKTTLQPLEATRRCHRLVGGCLVERVVGDVLPEIEQDLANYELMLKRMNEALLQKEKDIEAFMVKYKISMKGQGNQQDQQQPNKQADNEQRAGVLA